MFVQYSILVAALEVIQSNLFAFNSRSKLYKFSRGKTHSRIDVEFKMTDYSMYIV